MKKTVTLKNNFHNTECRVRLEEIEPMAYKISMWDVKRIEKKLCGIKGCTCSGATGIRDENCDVIFAERDFYIVFHEKV